MSQLVIKKYIKYLYSVVFVSFVVNKIYFRPWVLAQSENDFLVILVNSYPNFAEAVLGSISLAGIGFLLRGWSRGRLGRMSTFSLHAVVTIVAGIYVITQELKIHNLGGTNIYDPYDLVASVIGLVFINVVLNVGGIFQD